MNPIGFKYGEMITANHPSVIQEQFAQLTNVEMQIKQKGLEKALDVVMEYLTNKYPHLKGEARDKKYMSKLKQIKCRYFDEI